MPRSVAAQQYYARRRRRAAQNFSAFAALVATPSDLGAVSGAFSATLTLGSNPDQNDTVDIGAVTYTFRSIIESEKATGVLTATGVPNDSSTVTIGNKTYRFKNTMAQANDIQRVADVAAVKASGVLTATDVPADGDTVTIGAQTYRYKDALAQANDVLIEGTPGTPASGQFVVNVAADGCTMFVDGDQYTGLETYMGAAFTYPIVYDVNTDAQALASCIDAYSTNCTAGVSGDTVTVSARVAGTAGNAITVSNGTNTGAWNGGITHLFGGTDGSPGTASDCLDNLIAAINGGAGSGTKYHAGTSAHATVDAAAGAGDTVDVTAKTAGSAGNSIGTSVSSSSLSFGDTTLLNGADAVSGASDTLDNLIAAINGDAGSGVKYHADTVASTQVDAAAGVGDTVDITASSSGVSGNSIATNTISGALSFGATTLLGGEDPESAYAVEIGGSASATLDNLIAAINGAAGEGTVYGSGTLAHPNVTAVAGAGDTMDVTLNTATTNALATDVGASSWSEAALSPLVSGALALPADARLAVSLDDATDPQDLGVYDGVNTVYGPGGIADFVQRLALVPRGREAVILVGAGCPSGTITLYVLDSWNRPHAIATATV